MADRAQSCPFGMDEGDGGIGHDTAIATIVRITAGHFRFVGRLLTQIERVQTVNELETLIPEVVEAARQALPVGR